MRLIYVKAIFSLLVVLAACGSPSGEPGTTLSATTTTTTVAATIAPTVPELVMIISENGGCFMMGPNCRTFGLWSDGTAAVYRVGAELAPDALDQGEAEAVTVVDPALAAQLATISAATDFNDLEDRLGPGSCQACVDGIDYLLTLYTDAGPRHLSSNEFRFDDGEPLFQAVNDALTALSEALPLSVETRP